MILKLLRSDAFWRYLDTFSPRIFALGMHSLVVWALGSAEYALAAWVAGTFALLAGLIPDPHSYLYVRAHGERASRLAKLITPVMWAKALLVTGISILSGWLLTSDALKAPVQEHLMEVLLGASVYSVSELLWAYAGAVGFVSERMRRFALTGFLARTAGGLLSIAGYYLGLNFGTLMMVYAAPTLLAILYLLPLSLRVRRSLICAGQALKRYTLWSQGISLSTVLVAQMLPAGAGMLDGVSASEVGIIGYASRLLSGVVAPFQVLQSIVIKEFAKAGYSVTTGVSRYQKFFRVGALVVFGAMAVGTVIALWKGTLGGALAGSLLAYGFSTCVFTWYRYEISLQLIPKVVDTLFIRVFLPVTLAALGAGVLAGWFAGIHGLAVAGAIAWLALSFSWKAVPQAK